MKKSWLIALLTLSSFLSGCATMQNVWSTILNIGDLSFLGLSSGATLIAFMRLLLGFLVFTLIYALIRASSGSGDKALGFLQKNHAVIVAAIVAAIASIFLPAEVILATGAGWATVVALVLLGVPIVAVFYLLSLIPEEEEPETKWTVLLKLLLCLLLFWILTVMKYHVGGGLR